MSLYELGVHRLQEKFEIIPMIQQLRMASLMYKIMFSKYQRALVPYFKHNLVTQSLKHEHEFEEFKAYEDMDEVQ
jgi:hypothetical protein